MMKIKTTFALIAILLCVNILTAQTALFKTDIAEDATPAVLDVMMSAQEKPLSEVKFEKGTYHFYPERGFESFNHVSNHGDNLSSTAFPILNLKNLTIDGQGSTFIFHGIMIPFLIEGSENITIKNLSIDWAQSFHSEMLVIARDEAEKTFDVQISEEYPYEIRNDQLIFVKEYYEHPIGQSILFDPVRHAIAFDTESYTGLNTITRKKVVSKGVKNIKYKYEHDKRAIEYKHLGKQYNLRAEQLKSGLIRIHNHTKKMPPVGTIVSCKGDQGFNRVAPAFRLTEVSGFNALNVNVHHAGGMGLIAENSKDLTLDNFNVEASQGRMVSTTADATHFVGCRGKVILKNCTFKHQLDDATNVHGSYQKVVEIMDEYTVRIRAGHHQQMGFSVGIPNDTIGFVRLSDAFFPYTNNTIKSLKKINGRIFILTFNNKLPKELKTGDLVENLSAYPDLIVKNCHIGSNRARGLLLSTPKTTLIEDNFFHTEMEALLIPVESGHWYESGNAANVIIRNNVFQDCQHSGFKRGVIRFATDDDNENIAFRNIEISNNTFNHFDNLILQVTNVSGLKFTKNTITNSGTFPQLHPENPAFRVESSENVVFKKNKYKGKATTILETDKSVPNLKFN